MVCFFDCPPNLDCLPNHVKESHKCPSDTSSSWLKGPGTLRSDQEMAAVITRLNCKLTLTQTQNAGQKPSFADREFCRSFYGGTTLDLLFVWSFLYNQRRVHLSFFLNVLHGSKMISAISLGDAMSRHVCYVLKYQSEIIYYYNHYTCISRFIHRIQSLPPSYD